MAQHTPGPWKLIFYKGHKSKGGSFVGEIVSEQKGYRKIYNGPFSFHSLGNEANAQLIAAAPDLLAACEAALRVFWIDNDAIGYGTYEQGQIAAQMRDAIAKAKGE